MSAPSVAAGSAAPAAAPPRARTPWPVWVAVLGVAAVGIGGIAAADPPPAEGFGTAAEAFMPEDGTAMLLEYSSGERFVREIAMANGLRLLFDQPAYPANAVLESLEVANAAELRFMRITVTDLEGVIPQAVDLYRISEDGVALVMSAGGFGNGSHLFDPGRIALPADAAPGSEWASEGSSLPLGLQEYRMKSAAGAGAHGCLEISSELVYTDPQNGNAVVETSTSSELTCPDLGTVRVTFDGTLGGGSATISPLPLRGIEGAVGSIDPQWPDAAGWTQREFDFWISDPLWGDSEVLGSNDGAALTSSGTAVFVSGTDAHAYSMRDSTATRIWTAHPGGQLLRVAAIGDAVLLTSSRREVTAYDSAGRRAWTASFPDIALASPVGDGRGGAVVASVDGTVARIDLASGEESWRVNPGGEIAVDPAVSGGRVYVADRDGAVIALDVSTGEQLWTAAGSPARVIIPTEHVVAVAQTSGEITSLDPATGDLLWRSDLSGFPRDGEALDNGTLVIQTGELTTAYSPEGRHLWSRPGVELALTSDGELVLGLGSDGTALLLDRDGAQLRRWELPISSLGVVYRLVDTPRGVWVVGSDLTITELAAP